MVDLAGILYGLLKTAAALAATAAAGELGKAAVKDAYEALKSRLADRHGATSVALVEQAGDKPAYAEAIRADLAKPGIAADPEIARLTAALRDAIAAIPPAEEARYAVDIRQGIEAARNITFRDIEGLRADSITAREGDLSMENIKAPPGKP
jgi:hypothetical protein